LDGVVQQPLQRCGIRLEEQRQQDREHDDRIPDEVLL